MSGSVKGFIVTLERDVSDEHAARIVDALILVRGVVKVQTIEARYEDLMIAERVRAELRDKLREALK